MVRPGIVLACAAAVVAATDLVHKAAALTDPGRVVAVHERPNAWAAVVVAISATWVAGILLTRSRSLALGGGVFVGGAAGNVASLVLWPSVEGVPNPLVAREIAFNLADVAVALGLGLVVTSAVVFAVRNRAHLGEPVHLRR